MLLLYALARICQLYADKHSSLAIVMLHVVPPAVFALLHGSMLYRLKGILVFTALCLGFGALLESLSLRTGFPFGHYYFTDVMGMRLWMGAINSLASVVMGAWRASLGSFHLRVRLLAIGHSQTAYHLNLAITPLLPPFHDRSNCRTQSHRTHWGRFC